MATPAANLRKLLAGDRAIVMPCCFDALSARLIERAGFPVSFMSGFAVAAARLGLPDTGLISYGEMVDQGRNICAAVEFPIIGDGDTGYGNAVNISRTYRGYAQAGFAGIMLEDQVSPKRCGHTQGKEVVTRTAAVARIRAAIDARNESGQDMMIIARTDARATDGLDEAIARCQEFAELGADITFLEAPQSIEEMGRYCDSVPGIKMANMVEQGVTPVLLPTELAAIGYRLIAYPLTLLASAVSAMESALASLSRGQKVENLTPFAELRELVGFDSYDDLASRYSSD